LSQKVPKITPSRPQNMPMVIALVILKPMTRSNGAFIGSGFAGIARYAPEIMAAYATGIIAFFIFKAPIFRYKNASPSALNPDITKNATYRLTLFVIDGLRISDCRRICRIFERRHQK